MENKRRESILMAEPFRISRRYTYDAENQLTSVTYEDGVVVSYAYDKAGNRISVTWNDIPGSVVPVVGAGQTQPQSQKTSPPPVHAEQQRCGNCGTPVLSGKMFCSGCGAPISVTVPSSPGSPDAPQTLPVCPGCGSPVKAGIKYCGDCGRRL